MILARRIVCLGLAACALTLCATGISGPRKGRHASFSMGRRKMAVPDRPVGHRSSIWLCGRALWRRDPSLSSGKDRILPMRDRVSDDDEIERVGDLELIGPDYKALASGHPVTAGLMIGRARLYAVERPLQSALPVLTIALANKCDAIVATVTAEPQAQSVAEAHALDFLRSAAIQHWVEAQGGSQ